jgi:hypothetical protein
MIIGAESWRERILEGVKRSPFPVVARTPLKRVGGYSQAAVIDCDNGRRYVVKGQQVGRALVADHIVGRLGQLIAAPVAEVDLVTVSTELIDGSFSVQHFKPGIGHGSAFARGYYDGWGIEHIAEEENQERFALLAVLFGWVLADDQQFLYRTTPPHLVLSVDHGHFFAGGPDWTIGTLATAPASVPDNWIISFAAVSSAAIRTAIMRLHSVTDAQIAEVVAAPPDSWGIDMEERVALAQYLAQRRTHLLATVDSAS